MTRTQVLVHFGAREYDPETGSFTRKDPSRFGGGENLYVYAGGDPINFVDPNGEGIVGAVLGGLEGGAVGYAEEGAVQVLDKDFAGFDCGKLRGAAGWGAAFGAAAGAARSTGRQCFAAGTEIATEEGPKAIEKVAVGDRVLSRSEKGELSYEPVTRLFVRANAEEVALTFTDVRGAGATIVTTPEHPFRVASGEWAAAGRLGIGDNVVTAEGELATLSAALSLEKRGTVYNFEVAGTHTYFVGEAKLWVHNKCTRAQAMRQAQNHAQVPRESRGGDPIPFNRLNGESRGPSANRLQAEGATNVGREHPATGAQVFDHPDGHPDLTGPDQPPHHDGPHVHAVNAAGHKKVFPYEF